MHVGLKGQIKSLFRKHGTPNNLYYLLRGKAYFFQICVRWLLDIKAQLRYSSETILWNNRMKAKT